MKNRITNMRNRPGLLILAILQLALGANAASRVSLAVQPYAPLWAWPIWTPSEADPDIAVWVFYRAPENVPLNFNLLEGFDWSDRDANGIPDPWDYPLLVRGFEIFQEPSLSPPPYKVLLREIDEVPIWFTTREEVTEVLNETGTITFKQLSQMTSLAKGSATYHHEESHYALGDKAQINTEDYQARGLLEDGRSFSVHIVSNWHGERENYVFSVEFK